MEASCVGAPVVGKTTLSLQDFLHAFEPSNRVFPVAHRLLRANRRSNMRSYRIGKLQFAHMRHRDTRLTTHIAHRPQSRDIRIPFRLYCLGLESEAGRGPQDAEQ